MKKSYRLTKRPPRIELALNRHRPAPTACPCPLCGENTGYGHTRERELVALRPLSLKIAGINVVRHFSQTCTVCPTCGFGAYLGPAMAARTATKFEDALQASHRPKRTFALLTPAWQKRARKVSPHWVLARHR